MCVAENKPTDPIVQRVWAELHNAQTVLAQMRENVALIDNAISRASSADVGIGAVGALYDMKGWHNRALQEMEVAVKMTADAFAVARRGTGATDADIEQWRRQAEVGTLLNKRVEGKGQG